MSYEFKGHDWTELTEALNINISEDFEDDLKFDEKSGLFTSEVHLKDKTVALLYETASNIIGVKKPYPQKEQFVIDMARDFLKGFTEYKDDKYVFENEKIMAEAMLKLDDWTMLQWVAKNLTSMWT